MNFLIALVRFALFVLILPLRVFTVLQYIFAVIFYKKNALVLDSKWKIGHHVVDNKTQKKCIVIARRKINRSPCPPWYKTYVAIKPSKK